MRSSTLGSNTSQVEVLDISRHGIWLYIKEAEYFLPYKEYPWFMKARVSEIYNLKLIHNHHIYWPDLDVDLELNSLKDPDNYPLIYR